MSLGLRFCPQHPTQPLMLVSRRTGLYWHCEHASGCAHTESVFSAKRSKQPVREINGHGIPHGRNRGAHGLAGDPTVLAAQNNERNSTP